MTENAELIQRARDAGSWYGSERFKGPLLKRIAESLELAEQKGAALRVVHAKEEFGDCVEDGEPFPCKTIRVLDFTPSTDTEGVADEK